MQEESADRKGSVWGSLKKLFRPVLAPRTGFDEVLSEDDPVSFAVFSVLLGYFFVALPYSLFLRQAAPGGVAGLAAAVPFIISLTALLVILLTGLYLLIAGKLAGSKRPYGHWVGLAAFTTLPGMCRLLWETLRLAAGSPPAETPALSVIHFVGDAGTWGPYAVGLLRSLDPFQVWSLVVMAVGFSIYASRPTWLGGVVALMFWAVQVGLAPA